MMSEKCSGCDGDDLSLVDGELTCCSCGLVAKMHDMCSVPTYEQPIAVRTSNRGPKLSKMQEWYMWSNADKNRYKLTNYTTSLCTKLDIPESIVPDIVDIVLMVMDVIKKNDGTKRARVKDAIIIMCIHYYSKNTRMSLSYIELAKKLNLELKYISKADKIILELMNTNKLCLDKHIVFGNMKPYDYVVEVINRNKVNVSTQLLEKVKNIIDYCEENDLLLDHTPLSVGVSCFYYVLKTYNVEFDVDTFTTMYDLSIVTVIKTYNKLKAGLQSVEATL
jgi:transcription initiation factor TFIIIB Brf1 subunit/transcription initiation factor TFIIB